MNAIPPLIFTGSLVGFDLSMTYSTTIILRLSTIWDGLTQSTLTFHTYPYIQ
jgi:hypothetical protein